MDTGKITCKYATGRAPSSSKFESVVEHLKTVSSWTQTASGRCDPGTNLTIYDNACPVVFPVGSPATMNAFMGCSLVPRPSPSLEMRQGRLGVRQCVCDAPVDPRGH